MFFSRRVRFREKNIPTFYFSWVLRFTPPLRSGVPLRTLFFSFGRLFGTGAAFRVDRVWSDPLDIQTYVFFLGPLLHDSTMRRTAFLILDICLRGREKA